MKNLNDILFIDHLPKLDLHGYDCETARVAILDFIKDQQKLKEEFILIIHGIGSGAIRRTTHETLRQHKEVLDYKTYYYNQGCTIAQIRLTIKE